MKYKCCDTERNSKLTHYSGDAKIEAIVVQCLQEIHIPKDVKKRIKTKIINGGKNYENK